MRTLPAATAALALLLAAGPGLAQRDWSQVEIEAQQVAPGIHMLRGAGGNLGVSVGEDGVFLVDDQFAPLTEKITAAIAAGFGPAQASPLPVHQMVVPQRLRW